MRIDVEFDGEIMLTVGGRWDRRLRDYDGEADKRVVARPHVGEYEAIRWYMDWLGVHAGRRDTPPDLDESAIEALETGECDPSEVFSAMWAGGRRGGKTWTASLAGALYALLFPDAIVWVVNPNQQKHDEIRRYFGKLLAPEWIDRETQADGWELANGSAIMLKSGYIGADPDAIKEGEAHLVIINEGQKMGERVYVVARGATADHSGLVLVCANPPVQKRDQQWVGDFAADAQAQRRMAHYIHFNPLDNPHINRLALMSLRRELDERSYRIEILGEFLPPVEMVAYNWVRTKDGNEQPAPTKDDPYWIDVTAAWLAAEEIGDGYTDIAGMDFQVHPHMGGPIYRIFAPRKEIPTRENVVMWGVDEIVIEGDEAEWCAEAEARGYTSPRLLIIGDGTGEYQHSRRGSVDSPPPTWKGKGSFEIIKMNGFWNIIRPDPRIPRNNPHVIDRVRALTSMIESSPPYRTRRLFLDPKKCPKTAKSIREWPTVNGKPSRSHEAAHLGDGASYPIVRLFPRKLRSEKPGLVDTISERVDLPMVKPKFLGPPPKSPRHTRDKGL